MHPNGFFVDRHQNSLLYILFNDSQNLLYQLCKFLAPQAFQSQPDYRWTRMPANLEQSMKIGIKRDNDSVCSLA